MEKIKLMELLFYSLIFPGFLFLALSGMFISWIDRKVTARLQWRVGPPLLQPFYDLRKLFFQEGNSFIFFLAPFAAFVAILLLSNILILTWITPQQSFIGDLIVVLYLLTVPPLACILGASASNSPFAALGASREMKSILSYELPFVISALVPVVKAHSLSLGTILQEQQLQGSFIASLSGALALVVAGICLQAKLGIGPFDYAEAETEIASGSQIEYSGPLLAVWKLGKMMFMIVGPLFLIFVFWGSGGAAAIALKYFALTAASILVKNTNPRLRIDQSVRFFWSTITLLSLLALVFAFIGW